MRFSVDAHAIGCHLTGNEVYIRSLLMACASVDSQAEFIAYVSSPEAAALLPSGYVCRRVSRNPFRRLGLDLPRLLRQDQPDLLHVQYTAPLACPAPVVVTVHDVSFIDHPEYFTPARALQLRKTVSRTVARAARVLTGSEFSRKEIAKAYGLEPEAITVVPNAAASLFRPLRQEECAARVRERFGIPSPFILTVGDLQARKNQAGLIRAFAELARAFPQLQHHLVLAGKENWHGAAVRHAAARSGMSERIHFTGFVSDDNLLDLYNACDFFVFPSFYEGFGLPVLEAMACGKPVACSSNSALHEVADAAAILFDAQSIGEMVRAMADLALDPELRTRMGRLGMKRAAQFSWRKTAEETLEVYHEVARQHAKESQPHRLQASVSK